MFQAASQPVAELAPCQWHIRIAGSLLQRVQYLQQTLSGSIFRQAWQGTEFVQAVVQGTEIDLRRVCVLQQRQQRAGGVVEPVQHLLQGALHRFRPVRQARTASLQVVAVAFQAACDVLVQDDILLKAAYLGEVFIAFAEADKRRFQYVQQWAAGEVFFDAFQPAFQRGRGTGGGQRPATGIIERDV